MLGILGFLELFRVVNIVWVVRSVIVFRDVRVGLLGLVGLAEV